MTSAYGPAADKDEMIRLIRIAYEELVGEALEPIRDQVIIATKFGFDINPQTGERDHGTNSRPDHIKAVADACLKRLRVG